MTVRPAHLSMPCATPACDDVEQALRRMRADGHRKAAIWGAGDHTRRILGALYDSPIDVACLVDDDPGLRDRRVLGWEIVSSEDLLARRDVTAVLISSRYEPHVNAMWRQRDLFADAGKTLYRLSPEDTARPADLSLPPVLTLTVPKSGTWLLMQLLTLAGFEAYRGQGALARLASGRGGQHAGGNQRLDGAGVFELLPAGQVTTLHDPAVIDATVVQRFLAPGHCRAVLLIRDPRDVVVARAHFWKHPDNPRHLSLRGLGVRDVMDRLIEGYGTTLPGINELMMSYRMAYDAPQVHVIRFEEIVRAAESPGDAGAVVPIRALLRHVGVGNVSDERLHAVLSRLEIRPSPGRKAVVAEWQTEFGDRQRTLFAKLGARCLDVFGYDAGPLRHQS